MGSKNNNLGGLLYKGHTATHTQVESPDLTWQPKKAVGCSSPADGEPLASEVDGLASIAEIVAGTPGISPQITSQWLGAY